MNEKEQNKQIEIRHNADEFLKNNNFAIKTDSICKKCTPYMAYDEKMQELNQQLAQAREENEKLTYKLNACRHQLEQDGIDYRDEIKKLKDDNYEHKQADWKIRDSLTARIGELEAENNKIKETIYKTCETGQAVIKSAKNDYNSKIWALGYLQTIKDYIYNAKQALGGNDANG